MAISIKALETLPMEVQANILNELSLSLGIEHIEIDGKVYTVHEDVVSLIDNLIAQLERMKNETSKYKR